MRFSTSRRVLFAIGGYLLIGIIFTFLAGGFFSGPVTMRNNVLSAPYQEFLHAKGETSSIGSICKGNTFNVLSGDKVAVFTGTVVLDERGKPKYVWISPFTTADDAVCFHITSEQSATIEYFARKPAAASSPSQTLELIFIDECWPKLRLKEEILSLNESGKFDFYICPAEPLEHNTTIAIYGFGVYSDYAAKVSNPKSLPYINRSRGEILANSLNYMWAVPLDCAIMPIAYPAFQIWWHYFVKF